MLRPIEIKKIRAAKGDDGGVFDIQAIEAINPEFASFRDDIDFLDGGAA